MINCKGPLWILGWILVFVVICLCVLGLSKAKASSECDDCTTPRHCVDTGSCEFDSDCSVYVVWHDQDSQCGIPGGVTRGCSHVETPNIVAIYSGAYCGRDEVDVDCDGDGEERTCQFGSMIDVLEVPGTHLLAIETGVWCF